MCALVLLSTGGIILIHIIGQFDLQILEFIRNNFLNGFLNVFFKTITFLGDKGLIWVIISIALILTKNHRKTGLLTLLALILATLLGEGIFKHLFQRPRPFVTYSDLKPIITASGFSFPSGHTTSSFAAAGVLAVAFKKYRYLIFGFSFAIAFSRLYLMVHYPSDIVAGIILGLASSMVILKLSQKYTFNKSQLNS